MTLTDGAAALTTDAARMRRLALAETGGDEAAADRLLVEARSLAASLVAEHHLTIRRLAEQLLRRRELDAAEVAAITDERTEMAAKSTPERKAELVECFVAHAVTDPDTGIPLVVASGTRWRSDSTPVKLNGQFFHGDGLAEPEKPSWTAFVQQPAPAPVASSPPAGARPRGLTTGG